MKAFDFVFFIFVPSFFHLTLLVLLLFCRMDFTARCTPASIVGTQHEVLILTPSMSTLIRAERVSLPPLAVQRVVREATSVKGKSPYENQAILAEQVGLRNLRIYNTHTTVDISLMVCELTTPQNILVIGTYSYCSIFNGRTIFGNAGVRALWSVESQVSSECRNVKYIFKLCGHVVWCIAICLIEIPVNLRT